MILQGDAIEQLRTLPSESVHCCVTSPPYWGLRNYGVEGQLGLEKTPEEYVAKMVEVFREVRRVLRGDGTLWLNIGDSYASSGKNRTEAQATAKANLNGSLGHQCASLKQQSKLAPGYKPKDLIGIPWMLAFALRADGWYLRQDIIWHKPGPMPESVRDRCSKAHEYIFLFAKSQRYYFDQEAILEKASANTHARISQDLANQVGSYRANGGNKTNGPMKAVMRGSTRKLSEPGIGIAANRSFEAALAMVVEKRNKRSVWKVASKGYKGAHFATFPPKLIEPCILAGTSEEGCCSQCGAPWKRVLERERKPTRPGKNTKLDYSPDGEMVQRINDGLQTGNRDPQRHVTQTKTKGWKPTCECGKLIIPCTVLDPFAGSGTTLAVAEKWGRKSIGIELNPKYITLIEERLAKEKGRLFA